jgi:hypothetical protein
MYWPTPGAHSPAMFAVLPLLPKPIAPPPFEAAPDDVPTGLPELAPEPPVSDPGATPLGVSWPPHPDTMRAAVRGIAIRQGPVEGRENQSILRKW